MPHPGLPRKVNPDEDLQFINITRGSQTEEDQLEELYLNKKKDFYQLSVFYDELDTKYEKAKLKFAEAKDALEQQKAREMRLPVMYRDAYTALLQEHRSLEKKYNAMKEQLRQLVDY